MALQKLIESYAKDWNDNKLPLQKIKLKESKENILIENKEKKVLEGYIVPIWRLDQKNLNERIYTKKLGEKIVKEQPITLMLADHPTDEGSVKNIIGVTKNPFIKENILYAECYIVDNSFKEKLDKIIELGSGIGLSSSALGELNESNEVVVESFQIERLADGVLQPSYAVFIDNKAPKVIKEEAKMTEQVENIDEKIDNKKVIDALQNGKKVKVYFTSTSPSGKKQEISVTMEAKIKGNTIEVFYQDDKGNLITTEKYSIKELDKSLQDKDYTKYEIKESVENIDESTQTDEPKIEEEVEQIEETTDTEEARLWILNTEPIYKQAQKMKNMNDLKAIVKGFAKKANIDVSKVDFKELMADIKDMLESKEKENENKDTKIMIVEDLNKIVKNLKEYNLEQKNFILSMDKFIKEALEIDEIEEKISKFKELYSWCNNDEFAQPIKNIIESKLNELNNEFEELAMKGKKTDTLEKEVTDLDKNLKEKETELESLSTEKEELYEKFDELKIHSNKLKELYTNLVNDHKELKEKIENDYVIKTDMTSAIEYIDKLEQALIDTRKDNDTIMTEKKELENTINEIKEKEKKEEEELNKLIQESEKKKQLQALKEKEEKEKIMKEKKEKTCSFDKFRPEVLSLYEDWEKQNPKIKEFKELFTNCRNISEAQYLKLKLKSELTESFDYKKFDIQTKKIDSLDTEIKKEKLDEKLDTSSEIEDKDVFNIPSDWN